MHGGRSTLEELKLPPGLRLLGLDLGEKTIGLALSDTLLSVATPMQTLKRGKFAADAARLDIIISEQGVGGLVVGLPLNMDGSRRPLGPVGPGLRPQLGGPQSPCPWCSRMSGFPPAPSPAPCWKPMPRAGAATRWWTRWRPLTSCRARWTGCGTCDDERFRARTLSLAAAGLAPAGARSTGAPSASSCWSAPRLCSPAMTSISSAWPTPQIQASLHIPENQIGLTIAYFRLPRSPPC